MQVETLKSSNTYLGIKFRLARSIGIKGCLEAVVHSETNPGKLHAVLIDNTGLVIHDPNPNQKWINRYPLEESKLVEWFEYQSIN